MNVSNGKNSFLKKHGRKLALAFFVAVIVVGIYYFVIKPMMKKKGRTGPSPRDSGKPELSVAGEKRVVSVNTSGYSFRREMNVGTFRGDNISFSLTINTKGGFKSNDITHLKIERKNDVGDVITTLTPNLPIEEYSPYTVDFLGTDISGDAVSGDFTANNTFVITAIKSDGKEYTEINPMIEKSVEILKSDLNYTVDSIVVTPFTFNMSGTTGLTVSDPKVLRTKYYLSLIPDDAVYLIPGSTSDTFSFKNADTGALLTVDGIVEFTFDSAGTDTYRMYSGNKILTKGSDGNGVLKVPNDMTREEAIASLVEIKTVPTPAATPTATPAATPTATPPPPPSGPPPCPWGYTRKYGSSVCTDDNGCPIGQMYDDMYGECI